MRSRRTILLSGLGAALVSMAARAGQARRLEVWRDAACGCCGGWVDHMRREGFAVQDNVAGSVAPARRMLGTPPDLLSCHAARVDGYVLEGHVPELALRRLLATRPPGILGIAVPAMPAGTPGMEIPGQPPDTYDVIAFGGRPHRTFMRFRGSEPA
ncbi:DUF411 domain-containing protein [Roseomonas sp. CAU 1739]|uniref:DUF411 domain-containing protein n=1 Tax=Roseomonas sp. CAU 1739 TaxID=3140364 RepID=UPI00325A7B70